MLFKIRYNNGTRDSKNSVGVFFNWGLLWTDVDHFNDITYCECGGFCKYADTVSVKTILCA